MHASVWITDLRHILKIAAVLLAVSPAGLSADDAEPEKAEPAKKEAPSAEEATPAGEPANSNVLLKFKYKPGQVVRYEVQTEMEITTLFNGAQEVARNKSNTRRSYKVGQVTPEGQGDLQLTIEWVHMFASFDTGDTVTTPIEFQSDNPSKHPKQFQPILEIVGKPTATIQFDSSGRPVKVAAAAARPKTAPAVVKGANNLPVNPLAAPLQDASPESYLVPLPEKPVSPGNTWKERFEVVARDQDNLPTRILMQRTYKFAEIRDGIASIEFRTNILTPNLSPGTQAQLIQRETMGRILFDIERGLIVMHDSEVKQSVVQPFGGNSRMDAVSKYHEEILADEVATNAASDTKPTTSK